MRQRSVVLLVHKNRNQISERAAKERDSSTVEFIPTTSFSYSMMLTNSRTSRARPGEAAWGHSTLNVRSTEVTGMADLIEVDFFGGPIGGALLDAAHF